MDDEEYVTLSILIHAQNGMGKSWLGQSAPAPRLVLDAEGGSRVPWRAVNGKGVKQKIIHWDPTRDDPPVPGDWQTCHVAVRDFNDVAKAFAWLQSGDHDFRSVVLDSVTEIQQRCKDEIGGSDALKIQSWDLMFIRMSQLIRQFRDLTFHPTNPLDAVVFLALSNDNKNGTWRPWVQGGLATALPGYVDVLGYLYVEELEDGAVQRRLLIQPRDGFAAKDRTHVLSEKFGASIKSPDIEAMLAVLNDE